MNIGSKTRRMMATLLMSSLALVLPAMAADNDLVINNGRVIDPETMLDAVMNVGVKHGTIAVITRNKITGKETIDATGHLVAPGFIDTHFHALDGVSIRLSALDGHTRAWILRRAPKPDSNARSNTA